MRAMSSSGSIARYTNSTQNKKAELKRSNLLTIKELVLKRTFDKNRIVVYLETIESLIDNNLLMFENYETKFRAIFYDEYKIMFVGISEDENYIHTILLSEIRSYSLKFKDNIFKFILYEKNDSSRSFTTSDKDNYLKCVNFLTKKLKIWE